LIPFSGCLCFAPFSRRYAPFSRRYAPFASSGVRTHASMIAGLKSAALNHSAILAFFHIFNVESALIFYSVSMGVKDNF